MTLATFLIALTIGLPLALLLACTLRSVRENMLRLLPYAALPALLAALFSINAPALVLGNARIPIAFALDVPGAILLGAAAILWIAAGFYAITEMRGRVDAGRFSVCWLMTLTGCMGVYLAADMVSFYGLLALLSVGASTLVMLDGTPRSQNAAMIYLGIALFAETFLLLAFVLLASITPDNSLWISDAALALADSSWRNIILALLFIGFGIKAGLVPTHFFMPKAYTVAMIPVAAVVSGAVIKASILGLIRFLPQIALPDWGMAMAAIGLFGALYGVVIGLTQRNPKTILAYSSVSQMGFIIAIIGMGIMVADESSRLAAAFYAARHVLAKGGLFLAVGVIAATSLRRYWLVFTPVILIALSIAGLPFTGGALAKSVTKDIMGDGLAYTVATMSSVATTLLMLHFLRTLTTTFLPESAAIAPRGKSLPWLVLALASLVIPVAIYCFAPSQNIADAFKPYAIWSALWPILLGALLALGLSRIKIRVPEITPGDIGSAMLNVLARPAQGISTAFVKMDAALGRWPLATITLLSLLLLFGVAITLIGRI
ncbi:complex I subunit 5 family protein [Deefgea rivuli]|uniref:complex I subunit 5 family protein n=1 Tax=Deefgea rivuli TaxID=400948 RepID=UPI000487744F|nr:proton-conducting transporter membrane subunit [Deefgea rivuli]